LSTVIFTNLEQLIVQCQNHWAHVSVFYGKNNFESSKRSAVDPSPNVLKMVTTMSISCPLKRPITPVRGLV